MTQVTIKNLNAEIARRYPSLDIELVKGRGYFYFDGDDGFDAIDSIYVFALNQMGFKQWMEYIESNIRESLADGRLSDGREDEV